MPANRVVGFVACPIPRVRHLDDKRVRNSSRRMASPIQELSLAVFAVGLSYACEDIHVDLFEAAQTLRLLWGCVTRLASATSPYTSMRPREYSSTKGELIRSPIPVVIFATCTLAVECFMSHHMFEFDSASPSDN